jgi:hypothetical protein
MLENSRGWANFLDAHGYASDLIERIRSHHENREEREVEGQEDYFWGRVSTALLNHTLRELRVLRGGNFERGKFA